MPIYQTNIWICEICGKVESITKETNLWTNSVETPPSGEWDYVGANEVKKLACQECIKKENTDIHIIKTDDVTAVDVSII